MLHSEIERSNLFNKPFYSIVNPRSPARITNIMTKFNLKDRVLVNNDGFDFSKIDFTKTNKIILDEKKKSLNYLRDSIESKRNMIKHE